MVITRKANVRLTPAAQPSKPSDQKSELNSFPAKLQAIVLGYLENGKPLYKSQVADRLEKRIDESRIDTSHLETLLSALSTSSFIRIRGQSCSITEAGKNYLKTLPEVPKGKGGRKPNPGKILSAPQREQITSVPAEKTLVPTVGLPQEWAQEHFQILAALSRAPGIKRITDIAEAVYIKAFNYARETFPGGISLKCQVCFQNLPVRVM